jgi:hypothetical protein
VAASNSRLVGTPRWYPGSVVLVAARSVEVDHRTARSGSCCSAYWKFSLPTCRHKNEYNSLVFAELTAQVHQGTQYL